MLESIRQKLQGKKTYLVAVAAVLGIVIAWISGEQASDEAVKGVIAALLAMTLRAGIGKQGGSEGGGPG
jgi:VIT1/CCC1 family predicted Fe2+/Mn2+ transporter